MHFKKHLLKYDQTQLNQPMSL